MTYAVPLVLLALTIAAFLFMERGCTESFGTIQIVLRVLVALPLLASGIYLHFFRMNLTASIIPPVFPAGRFLVILTGLLEIAGAIGILVLRTSRTAALWISILMVAVFPANIYGAGKVVDGMHFPSVPVRLAMQILYVVLVLLAGRGLPRPMSFRKSV